MSDLGRSDMEMGVHAWIRRDLESFNLSEQFG